MSVYFFLDYIQMTRTIHYLPEDMLRPSSLTTEGFHNRTGFDTNGNVQPVVSKDVAGHVQSNHIRYAGAPSQVETFYSPTNIIDLRQHMTNYSQVKPTTKLRLGKYEASSNVPSAEEGGTAEEEAVAEEESVAEEETVPQETTSVPQETTSVPQETTAVPQETTAVPQETTSVPHQTTAVPHQTTAVPHQTTAVPQETTPFHCPDNSYIHNTSRIGPPTSFSDCKCDYGYIPKNHSGKMRCTAEETAHGMEEEATHTPSSERQNVTTAPPGPDEEPWNEQEEEIARGTCPDKCNKCYNPTTGECTPHVTSDPSSDVLSLDSSPAALANSCPPETTPCPAKETFIGQGTTTQPYRPFLCFWLPIALVIGFIIWNSKKK